MTIVWFLPTLVVLAALVPLMAAIRRAEAHARSARPLVVRVDDDARRARRAP